MTQDDLKRIEEQVRQHKEKGQSSNITLKVNLVESLLQAVRDGLPKAEVFNISAEFQSKKTGVPERKHVEKWASEQRKRRLEKKYHAIQDEKKLRQEKLLSKWKTFTGSLKKTMTN